MSVQTTTDLRKLNPTHFKMLRDIIYDDSGIFFPENKLYLLEGRLGARLNALGLDSFPEYLAYLSRPENQSDELRHIYNLVTINETYFFRYPAQLEVFKRVLLPELLKRKQDERNQHLRIWSTAASSGEEIFSIAILLREHLGADLDQWKLDLLGTDISKSILAKAEMGRYGKNSFRGNLDPMLQSKYFTSKDSQFEVIDPLKRMVEFSYLNLNDTDSILRGKKMDIILCRNVLIYFDKEMKRRLTGAMFEMLNHGGYLLLGETESLHGVTSVFKVEHFPGAFVYKKE